jgi:hypothetical protein
MHSMPSVLLMVALPVKVIQAIERAWLVLFILLGSEILLAIKSAQCTGHRNKSLLRFGAGSVDLAILAKTQG